MRLATEPATSVAAEFLMLKGRQMKFAVVAIAIVLGIVRPFLSPHPVSLQGSYEALAHLFVGGVVGLMACHKNTMVACDRNWPDRG